MKKIFKYIFVVLLGSFLMTACQQEELPPIAEASISNITIEPSYTSAVITCDVESNVTIEANMVHLSKSPDFSNCQQYCYIFKIFIIFAVDLHLKYGIRPTNC